MHNSQCTMRGRLKAKKICANRCTENLKKLIRMDLSKNKVPYITERVVNIKELQKLIENCFMLAQLLQKESPHKESFEPLLDELKKARAFEFEIDIRKANYCEIETQRFENFAEAWVHAMRKIRMKLRK